MNAVNDKYQQCDKILEIFESDNSRVNNYTPNNSKWKIDKKIFYTKEIHNKVTDALNIVAKDLINFSFI